MTGGEAMSTDTRPSAAAEAPAQPERRRWIVGLLVVVGVIVAALGGFWLGRSTAAEGLALAGFGAAAGLAVGVAEHGEGVAFEAAGLGHVAVGFDLAVEGVFAEVGEDAGGVARRTALSPLATSFSKTLSTARLLGVQARTVSPRRTAWRMISATTVVLPAVPGGRGRWRSPGRRGRRRRRRAAGG